MSDRVSRSLLVGGVLLSLAGAWLVADGRAAVDSAAGGDAAGADTTSDVELVPTTEVTPRTDGVVPESGTASDGEAVPRTARATFAGGCFWCMEPPFDALDGVESTTSGYAGGEVDDPSYRQVASGGTGHREVVQVTYDPSRVSYTRLLEVYWHNVDPGDGGGQFCDRGYQYTTAIYPHNDEQERLARDSRQRLAASGVVDGEVETEIAPIGEEFWPAEAYHQDFYRENPTHYERYRSGCGRDRVLQRIWGRTPDH